MATLERTETGRSTPRVHIRRMQPTDVAAVLEIEYASYSTPWSEATFRGLLRRGDADLFVAEATDEIVGYAVFWVVVDDGELGNIAVAEQWRGRGIATSLIQTVFDRARQRGVARVYLEVRISNATARRLYARLGFREVGRRPAYYYSPVEDALVLCRVLEPDAEPTA